MSRAFLSTYRPLCGARAGREASARHGLLPFIDGSCQREPDLEAKFPTISALCRVKRFAPRLQKCDRVAYMTKLGRYDEREAHWRLTALLTVLERFESHAGAAEWHRARGLALPRNCMVDRNPPLPLDFTDLTQKDLRVWEGSYRRRAAICNAMLVCRADFRELREPPRITRADWKAWNGGVPGTQTPPSLKDDLWQHLEDRAHGRA
ncbi:MAG: hypothetical protein JO197_18435 [Acidobacteria bacterium]|nr:hypothetical protein [Acidobacteriota bacterium]MBV9479082.1 hypothetical protein [Acidobacteriota bacterium]